MIQYQKALAKVLQEGEESPDRTGAGTTSLFGGVQVSFDLREGFPLQTTKKVSFKNVAAELLWFLDGDTDITTLVKSGVGIWTADWKRYQKGRGYTDSQLDALLEAVKNGDEVKHWDPQITKLPYIYGEQWRAFSDPAHKDPSPVDQIRDLVDGLCKDPHSRRHIVCAWNPLATDLMALPPCHTLFQMHVDPSKKFLDCHMYQRSADMVLGVPYNIASYALLTHLVAVAVGMEPRRLIITFGDAHVYRTHMVAARELLSRTPGKLPKLLLKPGKKGIFGWKLEDMSVEGYDPMPAVRAPLEVGK